MRLSRPPLSGERGSLLLTSLIAMLAMLIVGLGLLAIVDTQAEESKAERTRDHAFNLAESVLTSEAFVLGRHWPETGATAAIGTAAVCSNAAGAFGDTVGATTAAVARTARLRPNINASYTDSAYTNATWQVNVCDDTGGATVWDDALLTNGTQNYDLNNNKKVWVRAQATVAGRTRVLVGLIQARYTPAFRSKYGLLTGKISGDIGQAITGLTTNALGGVLAQLLGTRPLVAEDPDPAAPDPNGITGLRCGLLDLEDGASTCLTGTLAVTSVSPVLANLVTGGKIEQVATPTAADAYAIAQLRSQSQSSGTYSATSPGASTAAAAPACTITGSPSATTVVFIEKVGTGDQYCVLNLPDAGITWKALVIGSGRVVLRGAGAVSTTTDTFNGLVYVLNLQNGATGSGHVVLESGAHVNGAVYADTKNAMVSVNIPYNTNDLVTRLLCPGLLCSLASLVQALPVGSLINALVNGTCLVSVPILGCTVSLPGLGLNAVLAGILGEASKYGSAITADVSRIDDIKVYGPSGVVPGTFRDLQSAA